MGIEAYIKDNMERMVRQNVPFAVAALPGEKNYHLYSESGDLAGKFVIREFNCKKGIELKETACFDSIADDFAIVGKSDCKVESTDKIQYFDGARAIIGELQSGGKTVYSKVIVAEGSKNPVDVAIRYHDEHPDTFRYICNTHEYGLWFGCTPELIMDVTGNKVRTMALAGTRTTRESEDNQRWDDKNVNEHGFVLNHILNVLTKHKLSVRVYEAENLQFGAIEHLMHRIEGVGESRIEVEKLLNDLTPTPAICGTPIECALSHISRYEKHKRLLYGGEVGIDEDNRQIYFANLRCACYLGGGEYALYVGGGLTSESDAETEWLETENKASSLLKILKERK